MKDREKLLKQLNDAFANCDTVFLNNSVTDDIIWEIVGEKKIAGRKDFENSLDRMSHGGPTKIIVNEILSSGNRSVVEGIVEFFVEPGKKRKYAFCDVYIFSETEENKFNELRTYVAQLKHKKK
ncbi:hypothetical protein ML462_07845 [Gramella lutea]|uniref:SnoaL-like domain-containing protein n=1 Tax=Christiangramia lutea TaxID=1607951 RepID=A0A9X1V3P1_9FLAO|nr:hypothetical protein [Christiangramia lutea]MCH4823086.1 hypothetical protein [Christiangramia lutea]